MKYSLSCSCGVWIHGDVPAETLERLQAIWNVNHPGQGHQAATPQEAMDDRDKTLQETA